MKKAWIYKGATAKARVIPLSLNAEYLNPGARQSQVWHSDLLLRSQNLHLSRVDPGVWVACLWTFPSAALWKGWPFHSFQPILFMSWSPPMWNLSPSEFFKTRLTVFAKIGYIWFSILDSIWTFLYHNLSISSVIHIHTPPLKSISEWDHHYTALCWQKIKEAKPSCSSKYPILNRVYLRKMWLRYCSEII